VRHLRSAWSDAVDTLRHPDTEVTAAMKTITETIAVEYS
jgi:hypothetical protein